MEGAAPLGKRKLTVGEKEKKIKHKRWCKELRMRL